MCIRDRCIARLNADGTLDAAFYPIFQYSGCVYALALQPDGKMIIGGSFTSIQAQDRYHLARLNACLLYTSILMKAHPKYLGN